MPRYFFDVEDDVASPDLDGVELNDLVAARQEACRMAGRLLEDRAELTTRTQGFVVAVRQDHDVRLTVSIEVREIS